MKNWKKIISECIRMMLLLIAVSIMSFVLIVKAPIDPLVSYIGTNSTISEEARQEIADEWGLNDPLPERFITWGEHALKGDLGMSITYKKPVSEVIKTRFSYSIVLMALSWILSGVIGFILGVICGIKEGSLFDRATKVFCLGVKSAPVFWIGLLVLSVFAVQLGWFPIGMAVPAGTLASEVSIWSRIHHLILPVLTLTIVSISEVVLYTRRKVIETMNSNFILYAKVRGENQKQIIKRHILKNVLLPAVTVQFSSFSELFGGMALAETVFAYPGIGTAITAAATNADVPLLLGISVFSALFVFAGNVIANILYGVFNPVIREGDNRE